MAQTWKQVSEDRYREMLNILPPREHTRMGFLVGEAWDHNGPEGFPRYAPFLECDGKYYEGREPITLRQFQNLMLTAHGKVREMLRDNTV